MDSYNSQGQVDRPPCPRTASRSSTSSTRTRLSNNSSSTSSQQIARGYPHRLPSTRPVRTPTTDRPRSQLSREASDDPRQPMPSMSTFLQERLDRERRVESDRSSSRASNDMMSASGELRALQASPTKGSNPDGRRPQSSGASEPTSKKKGLGLKEMEKTLSTLHKQNFDLKLELYHRREKQTALEARLESVESDKAQIEQINDQLLDELEKRDKAVEEAVAMIVVLEARVEQLLRERDIVSQFDQDGAFHSRSTTPAAMSTPKMKPLDLPKLGDGKDLARMPSFLSEHSDNTENLRNVYLEARGGSVVSLPPTAEDTPQTDRTERINSPAFSVLSESSFMSIYGPRHGSSSPPRHDSPLSLDGTGKGQLLPAFDSPPLPSDVTPSRPRQVSGSRVVTNGQSRYRNISGILGIGDSPLQRLEKMEKTLAAMNNASRPSTSYQEKDRPVPLSRPATTQPQVKTKQEKRQALEKVMTQANLGRELPSHHALPPTPDTISTTTLRRYQNSADNMAKDQSLVNERSYLALSETTTSQASGIGCQDDDQADRTPNPPSVTAFDSRRQLPEQNKDKSRTGRPRSASDSTMSHMRREEWTNEGSDDDDDEHPTRTDSQASSFDPWLREGMKTQDTVNNLVDPSSSVSQAGVGNGKGRVSPDLFSFPTTTNGWATNAMFGSSAGTGYKYDDLLATPMADTMDAIGRSLPTPLFGSGFVNSPSGARDAPPPAPNRRSSLHARTGSSALTPGSVSASPARPSPTATRFSKKSPARGSRRRSNSTDILPTPPTPTDRLRDINRASTVPPKQVHLPPPVAPDPPQQQASQPLPKQRHYPPTSSQAPRSRGLNNLFRRSTGSADSIQQQPAPAASPPTETTTVFGSLLPSMTVGVPWVKRNSLLVDDDRDSATPPPIMRTKPSQGGARHRSRMSDGQVDGDGGARLEPQEGIDGRGGGAPIGAIPGRESSRQAHMQAGYVSKPGTSGSASVSFGGGEGAPLSVAGVGDGIGPASTAAAPPSTSSSAGAGGGGKRRWLNIGRVGGLRKSTGATAGGS